MKKIINHPIIYLAIRLFVGVVFAGFGFVKLLEDNEIFYQSIRDYQMLPEAVIPFFGTVLPWLEVIIGLLFIVGLFTRLSAWGLTGMTVMFMIAITQAIVRGLELSDCGCSGSAIKLGESPEEVLFRDAILLALLVWFLIKKKAAQQWTLDRYFEKASTTNTPAEVQPDTESTTESTETPEKKV